MLRTDMLLALWSEKGMSDMRRNWWKSCSVFDVLVKVNFHDGMARI